MNLSSHNAPALNEKVDGLIQRQLINWPLAAKNYSGLQKVKMKHFSLSAGVRTGVQFNPERITSSAAKVDAVSIRERKCFLCQENLPPEQEGIPWGDKYTLLINPFPIFPKHLTIPDIRHTDQLITGRFTDMLDMAKELNEYVVFYNGPKCGASAPDHFHFQAGNKGFLPIEKDLLNLAREHFFEYQGSSVSLFGQREHSCIILEGESEELLALWFSIFMEVFNSFSGGVVPEPMINLLVSYDSNRWTALLFPRKLHRPRQYFDEDPAKILLSPASVDLGSMLITPRQEDFEKITAGDIEDILGQVCLSDTEILQIMQLFLSKIKNV